MNEREIFLEALEMPTPEVREGYLQGACGRDVTLRRKVDECSNATRGSPLSTMHSKKPGGRGSSPPVQVEKNPIVVNNRNVPWQN